MALHLGILVVFKKVKIRTHSLISNASNSLLVNKMYSGIPDYKALLWLYGYLCIRYVS